MNAAETPAIVTLDCPAIRFQHRAEGGEPGWTCPPVDLSALAPLGGLVNYDVSSLAFDHDNGDWNGINENVYRMTAPLTGLGQTVGAGGGGSSMLCPTCAYYDQGKCYWCPEPDSPDYPSERPECYGCKGKHRPQAPWYKRQDIMVPLLSSVAISTAAAVLSTLILRRTGLRK